ncbi:MAG: hypothetical protein AAF575_01740 [Bacteroidota bacterium]
MISKKISVKKPRSKVLLDLLAHYVITVWILVLLLFLTDQTWLLHGVNLFLCLIGAMVIVPLRLLAQHLLFSLERDKYIKKIVDELINDK